MARLATKHSRRRLAVVLGAAVWLASTGPVQGGGAAPEPIAPPNQAVMGLDDLATAEITLSWTRAASKYRLEVSRDDSFERLVAERTLAETFAAIRGWEAGTYYWRVAAVDSQGVRGPYSRVFQFSVEEERAPGSQRS